MESSGRRTSSSTWKLLAVHTLLILTLTTVFVFAMSVGSSDDANIGGAIVGMVLGITGVPWSAGALFADSGSAAVTWLVAGAWFNLFLHIVLIRRQSRAKQTERDRVIAPNSRRSPPRGS